MICECPVNYLCRVIQTIRYLILQCFLAIVAVYAKECLKNGKPDALKVKPTIMMTSGYLD